MLDKRRLRSFLLGGAAGLVAGVLLAPRSGRELRGSIKNRAGEAGERSRETYFDAQERMRERVAEAREGSAARRPETADLGGGDPPPPEEPQPAGEPPPWPKLRDVSRDVDPEEPAGESDAGRAEDLRRRVRETRARLGETTGRENPQKDGPEGEGKDAGGPPEQ